MKTSFKSFVGVFTIIVFFFALSVQSFALDNGLALTPPMGWNSWNCFQGKINEDLIKSIADAMVESGMKDAGYQYVVIDDNWQKSRDKDGFILPDPDRFPSGIKALADYIHSKGLKFGLYSDVGYTTCMGLPGSRGHEYQDALQYARWGVDYLKYDFCQPGTTDAKGAYSLMRDALASAGRPIVFSLCEWGSNQPWLWAGTVGNLWRTTGDIGDKWEDKDSKGGGHGWVTLLDLQAGLETYAGPGHWNDPDMMIVGNGKLTTAEYRAHFSFWCLLSAPLISGNDLRKMTPETKEILMNKEVIAIDQDPLGKQCSRIRDDGDLEVWAKQLKDGSRAVILFNRSKEPATIAFTWPEIGYPAKLSAEVRDLWQHKSIGKFTGKYEANVPGHDVVMIKVMP
jgi:alpha-galactosidase